MTDFYTGLEKRLYLHIWKTFLFGLEIQVNSIFVLFLNYSILRFFFTDKNLLVSTVPTTKHAVLVTVFWSLDCVCLHWGLLRWSVSFVLSKYYFALAFLFFVSSIFGSINLLRCVGCSVHQIWVIFRLIYSNIFSIIFSLPQQFQLHTYWPFEFVHS